MELVKQAADMVMEWADGAREAVLEALILCIGVIIGFMVAPIKKGISIASDNVNSFNNDEDEE